MNFRSTPAACLLLGIVIVSVLSLIGLRLFFAPMFSHPGHGDFAHYYCLAENIYNGRGLEVDYVWEFLNLYNSITHVPLFWMPLASTFMASFFHLTGPGVPAGILVSILILVINAGVIGWIAWRELPAGNGLQVSCAVLLTVNLPVIFNYSIITDAAIYNVLWVTISIYFLGKYLKSGHPLNLYPFALSAALVYYTRGDGFLLIGTACLVILAGLIQRRITVSRHLIFHLLGVSILYFVLIYPYSVFLKNSLPEVDSAPSALRLFFASKYSNFFSWGVAETLTLENWLQFGISKAIYARFNAASMFAGYILKLSLGTILLAPVLFAAAWKESSGRSFYLPMIFQGLVITLAYSVLLPFSGTGGSFHKSIISLYPLWALAILNEGWLFFRKTVYG